MVSQRLFELAFAFRKTRLWKRLYDTELFAFRREDGTLCFCCVMGQNGHQICLSVFQGQAGLDSYRAILDAGEVLEEMSPAQCHRLLYSRNCLQCSFENRDDMDPEQAEQVRDYARRTGMSLAGKNAFPCFTAWRPHRLPCSVEDGEDQALLCQALTAALEVDTLLKQTRSKQALGFRVCVPCEGEVPLLADNGFGGPEITSVALPDPVPVEYPAPLFRDELAAVKLARLPRKGYWQVKAVLSPQPMEDGQGGAPVFPANIIIWDSVSEMLSITDPVTDGPDQAETLLNLFCKALLHERRVPEEIQVDDEATRCLLSDLARKLGVTLTVMEQLDVLEDVEEQLYGCGDPDGEEMMDQLAVLVHTLSEMPVEDLADMPAELRHQLMQLDAEDLLPPDLSRKLADAFAPRRGTRKGQGKTLSLADKGRKGTYKGQSLVISVSLGTGCWRHIRLSADCTLYRLSEAILDAFGFEDDHLHQFGMDNRLWDSRDVYVSDPEELEEPKSRGTRRKKLGALGLEPGKQFKYLFDFGDEWAFQCKVLRVLPEGTPEPVVVRSRGEAPRQYGNGEEPDWEDDD